MKKFKFGCVRKLLLASILFPTLLIHAAGVKVSDLPAITSPAGADLALVVDMTAGVTKKLTWTNLLASVLAGETDPVVGAITGLVKSDGAATIAAAIADTDYQQVITWSDGLEYTAGTAKIDHNVTNLKITSSEIDTIQGISSAASPTFTGATLSGLNTASGLVQTDGSGILSTTLSPTGLTSITATTFTGALAGNADTATSLAGGAGGTIPYQSSANTTVMLANGTAGQILQANGTTVAPSWVAVAAETDPIVGAITGIVKADGAGNISAAVAGTDYIVTEADPLSATKALDNLASTAVNTDLVSDTDSTDSLGSSAIKWLNIFADNLGATGTRVGKGWFTDLEVTNVIAGSVTGNAGTVTNGVYTSDFPLNQSTTGTAALATSLAGGSGGTVPYQSSAGTTAMLANGTAGKVLQANGTTVAPSWETIAAGYTNLTSFVDQTAWRTFYSNTDGDVTELALGANATYLQSNGATSAPTWETIAAGGDVSKSGNLVNNSLVIGAGASSVKDLPMTAQSIPIALTANSMSSMAVTEQTIVGRKTGGNVDNLSATEVKTILALENVENTALSTGQAGTVATITGLAPDTATTQATQASITSAANLVTVGTIGTGTWEATDVAIAHGGTGAGVAATALTNLGGIGAATTDSLTNKTFDANGTGNSLSNVDVADLADGTDGELITWAADGTADTVAAGTEDQVLTSNGAGAAPTFQDAGGGGKEIYFLRMTEEYYNQSATTTYTEVYTKTCGTTEALTIGSYATVGYNGGYPYNPSSRVLKNGISVSPLVTIWQSGDILSIEVKNNSNGYNAGYDMDLNSFLVVEN